MKIFLAFLYLGLVPEPQPQDSMATEPTPPLAPPPEPNSASTTPSPASERALDERGDPVLEYDLSPVPPAPLQWATETPAPPEVQWSRTAPPTPPPFATKEGPGRPPPNKAALGRQSALNRPALAAQGFRPSSQRFALELKFGPYIPDVDRYWTGDGPGPYMRVFGETDATGAATEAPQQGLLSAVAFEWQFLKLGGPVLLGVQLGYFRDSANALLSDSQDVQDGGSVRSEADKTRFNVIPLALQFGYRFELAADRIHVPIVPYFKAGLAYGLWWTGDGNNKISVNQAGVKGRGGTWGWQVNTGAMLRLDAFDTNNAIELDRITKINHAYVFGELQITQLDDYGKERGVSVGDTTWMLGLAIEF